jgi:hypothetical protein
LSTLGIEKFMLAQTTTSYVEKNMNSKIGVQHAILVNTNETITVRRLRMTSTKGAIKGKDERGQMPLLIRTFKGLREKSYRPCDVISTCDQPLEAYVLQPKRC